MWLCAMLLGNFNFIFFQLWKDEVFERIKRLQTISDRKDRAIEKTKPFILQKLLFFLFGRVRIMLHDYEHSSIPINKTNSVALVRARTIPTEQPPLVGEVSANFCR
jgi:hypothetical protein